MDTALLIKRARILAQGSNPFRLLNEILSYLEIKVSQGSVCLRFFNYLMLLFPSTIIIFKGSK